MEGLIKKLTNKYSCL